MGDKQQNIIEFKNVAFAYQKDRVLFENVVIKFRAGGFYIIKGLSGIGKSSLLKLINRLEDPLTGEILFKGRPLSTFPPQELRRLIVYIQQTPAVVSGSVKDNLLLPFSFKSNSDLTRPDDTFLAERMDMFHLNDIGLNDTAKSLSVGQLQRMCIIRSLLLSPEVILLDEPTSALDEESSRIVESRISRLCGEFGQTVIMVNHKKLGPIDINPTILELADGRIKEI